MSNIYDSLLPLYYGTKFLGLSPFGRTENGFKASKIGTLYPMIVMLAIIVFTCIIFTDSPLNVSNLVMVLVTYGTLYANLSSVLIMYIFEIKNQKKICNIIDNFKEIDNAFELIDIKIPHEKNKIIITYAVVILYLLVGATSILDFIAYRSQFFRVTRLLLVFMYCIPVVLLLCFGCTFCIYVGLLRQRFKKINNALLQNILLDDIFNDEHLSDEEKISRIIQFLNYIKLIHLKLSKLFNELSETYSIQTLFSIGFSYFILFTKIYYWYSAYWHDNAVYFRPLPIIHTSLVIMTILLIIFLLTFINDYCVAEAKNTVIILCKVTKVTQSISVTNSVRLFIYQIMATVKENSAAGFFNVNRQLLHTIIGSAITYIVIFIQFELSLTNL